MKQLTVAERRAIGAQLRTMSAPRIWTPTGLISAVDVKYAQQLDWRQGFATFQAGEYTPDQWRHLMRLRARKWLEDGDWLPVKGSLFAFQLAILAAGFAQTFENKQTFSTPANPQVYTVDGGSTALLAKLWGASGASGSTNSSGAAVSGAGGGGAFATGFVNVTPGESINLYIPSKGNRATVPVSWPAAGVGGSSGGYAGLFKGSTPHLIAGGGGGGGGSSTGGAPAGNGGNGGAGGTTTGVAGSNSTGGQVGGGGGTQSAGGSGGSGGGSGEDGNTGGASGSLQGGWGGRVAGAGVGAASGGTPGGAPGGGHNGSDAAAAGGGGGGGYYGGGGGEAGFNSASEGGGGGGGGSSYLKPDVFQGSYTAGSGTTPGGNTDPDYVASAGVGGAGAVGPSNQGNDGNNGLVIIRT